MHLGVFGGTFDPPHIGHLIIAQEALHQARLDRVIFMPALVPPHKPAAEITPFPLRLAMVRAAIGTNAAFVVSDLEARLPSPSYTVDTLRALLEESEGMDRLSLIVGSDSLLDLPTWRSPEEVVRLARLVVYPRAGAPLSAASKELSAGAIVLDVPEIPLSSTMLRRWASEGRNLRYWLPEPVHEMVMAHSLYRLADRA